MYEITIHYDGKPIYPIVITDSFDLLGSYVDQLNTSDRKLCVVSDSHVAPHYLEKVMDILKDHAAYVTSFVFPAGEESKTLDTVQNLYEHLILEKFERRDLLVALGGGVVGDLTGYTAATFLRGIDFMQIPTSLLAQVDSSIGGKTGVDFRAYKNMVGAFHQPKLVYNNVSTLKTLTERQYLSGLGEIIKHGLIKRRDYYDWLKENRTGILAGDAQTLMDMIHVSDQIKQKVVENDPKEQGERAHLNFGHTLGHAVEKLMDFSMLHGECVAVGMNSAAWLSMKRGHLTEEEYKDILEMITSFGLPVSVEGITAEDIVAVSKNDKKMSKGKVKFVLLGSMGHAIIDRDISDDLLTQAAQVAIHS